MLLRFRRLASILSAVALLASPLRGIVLCEMPHVEQEPACHTDDGALATFHTTEHTPEHTTAHPDGHASAGAHEHAPAPVEQMPTHCDDLSACASVVALGACVTVPLAAVPEHRVTASLVTHDDAPARLLEPPPPRG
ncbi:MAG: hypothetical protein IT357_09665 [Gemmatimonadaceae bacterium]|nr:hypothetical protein [Gemmatimonadaceae bacterium]